VRGIVGRARSACRGAVPTLGAAPGV